MEGSHELVELFVAAVGSDGADGNRRRLLCGWSVTADPVFRREPHPVLFVLVDPPHHVAGETVLLIDILDDLTIVTAHPAPHGSEPEVASAILEHGRGSILRQSIFRGQVGPALSVITADATGARGDPVKEIQLRPSCRETPLPLLKKFPVPTQRLP